MGKRAQILSLWAAVMAIGYRRLVPSQLAGLERRFGDQNDRL